MILILFSIIELRFAMIHLADEGGFSAEQSLSALTFQIFRFGSGGMGERFRRFYKLQYIVRRVKRAIGKHCALRILPAKPLQT